MFSFEDEEEDEVKPLPRPQPQFPGLKISVELSPQNNTTEDPLLGMLEGCEGDEYTTDPDDFTRANPMRALKALFGKG